jgi:hypothetical protein
MSKSTDTPTDVMTAAVEGLQYLEGLLESEGKAKAKVLAVHEAVNVDGIGVRALAREAGCAGASVTYWAATGLIVAETDDYWETLGGVIDTYRLVRVIGVTKVRDAHTESETPEGFWRNLIRARDEAVAARKGKTTEPDKGKGKGKGRKTTPDTETPEGLWKVAQDAIVAALEATKAADVLTLAMADAIVAAGAPMVEALEVSDTIRANLDTEDRSVGNAAGRGDIVAAGK